LLPHHDVSSEAMQSSSSNTFTLEGDFHLKQNAEVLRFAQDDDILGEWKEETQ
jgi:hypothetical protein